MKLLIEIFEGVPHIRDNGEFGTYTAYESGKLRKSFVRDYNTSSFPRAMSFARKLIKLNKKPFDATRISEV
jgi:hypothetical protein